MAESSPVRLLQQHLRQAGALLASRQFEDAAKHIDAALAIDPASLAALTLRDRLTTLRGRAPATASPSISASANPPEPNAVPRFVPSGVNAASWLDFEQRIQDRRYRALIEAAEQAVAAGDGAAACVAIEEARELRPDSGDVVRLSARVALLQIPTARPKERLFESRTFRAASLLLLGVMSLMGLDWVRSEKPRTTESGRNAIVAASEPAVNTATATGASAEREIGGVPDARGTTGEAPPRLPLTYRSVAEPLSTATVTSATPMSARPVVPTETPDDYVVPSSAGLLRGVGATPPVINGEVSDDYVAPRRDIGRDATPTTGRPLAPAVPLANIARQPVTIESFGASSTGGSPTAVAASAAAVAPAAAPLIAPTSISEDARVNAVLNQYANAYGQLNASAVRSIWPTVDERALAKAFSNLSSQTMSFDSCDISVSGATARASCRGRASYVVKVGSQERRTEPRTVRFDLKRDGEAWKILKAETSR